MEAVAPSENLIEAMRALSRAGFRYVPTQALGKSNGWHLVDDEPKLGYVRFDVQFSPESDERRPACVLIAESGKSPLAFFTLFWFEEYEQVRRLSIWRFANLLTGSLHSWESHRNQEPTSIPIGRSGLIRSRVGV